MPTAEDRALQTIYPNIGEQASGGSVAAPNGKRMVIGAVFESDFLNGRPAR